MIEAGTDDLPFQQRLPYGAASALNESLLWPNYVSQPDPFLNNKTTKVRVAEILGGGSVVNGMFYDRGSAADYDAWESLGNSGWGWKGLYPYFKKGTTFHAPPKKTADDFNITWDPSAYVHHHSCLVAPNIKQVRQRPSQPWHCRLPVP